MTREQMDAAIREVNLRYTNNLSVLDVERALFLAGMRAAADIADQTAAGHSRPTCCRDARDAIRRAADELSQ